MGERSSPENTKGQALLGLPRFFKLWAIWTTCRARNDLPVCPAVFGVHPEFMPWIRSQTFHIRSKSVVRMSALLSRSWSNLCPDRCLVTIGVLRGRMGVVTQPPPCLLRTAFVASKSPINAVVNGLDYGQTINRTMTRYTPPAMLKKKGQALCLPSLEGVVIPVEKKAAMSLAPWSPVRSSP